MKPPYGHWITHEGELEVVQDLCSHQRHCPYEIAIDEGWIATVENPVGRSDTFMIRMELDTTTIPALVALRKLVKQSEKEDFLIENILCSETYYGMKGVDHKRGALEFINKLLSEKRKAAA